MFDNIIQPGYDSYVSAIDLHTNQKMSWSNYGQSKGGRQSYNCHYAVIMEDGTLERITYHTCFGRLNGLADWFGHDVKPYAILIQINTLFLQKLKVSKSMLTTYYKWLFTVSPFKDCFLSTYEQAIEDGVVVLSAKAESGLLGGACSAIRLIWEQWYTTYNLPSIVSLWYDVVTTEDVDPTLAFAFCNSVSASGGRYVLRSETAGHQFLRANDVESFVNFINNRPESTTPYFRKKGIDGINEIWEGSLKGSKIPNGIALTDWMKKHFIGEQKQVNIFAPQNHSTYFDRERAIQGILACIKAYQKG